MNRVYSYPRLSYCLFLGIGLLALAIAANGFVWIGLVMTAPLAAFAVLWIIADKKVE